MSAITLQFDTAADLESALLDALQNNEGHVSGIAAYLAQTGAEAVAPEAKADRAVFEQWYDAQPDGKLSPWDVWQSAIQHAIKSGHACTFALDNGGNLYRRYKEPQCAPPAPPAPPAPLPGKESERDLFKVTFPHLDLEETPDSWGRPEFAKPMVDAIWYGWKHRAALSSPPTLEAAPADYPPHLADEVERELALMIDRCPEPLRRLSDWLANKLDEDDWKTAERLLLGAVESVADRAQRSGVSADPLPLTDTYVQPVPDKCDRITWRGQYYHLPVSSQSHPLAEPVGEILSTCGYKEASWRKGKLPPIGTKLYAAPQPLVEPTVDMVLVPREPTQAMLIAAHAVAEDIRGGVFQKAYRAMLAASKGEKA